MRRAQADNRRCIVTLFVNPTQFGPTEDLAAYPRNETVDRDKLAALGVDVLLRAGRRRDVRARARPLTVTVAP